ncbi:MAG: 7-cyano-7-deazaguanine synthase [Victivallales bacterium]|nr:7-cyano-7-deazaguanine synthase [Victivallales bacterium]
MGKKALVLSSGGIDSTTCLAMAVAELGRKNVASITIFYGQKHKVELRAAHDVAKYYGIRQYEFDLSKIMQFSNCALLAGSTKDVILSSYKDQIAENGDVIGTYVPFRNGLMLSTAASLAQSLYEKDTCDLYIGAHKDDATGNAYADCSVPFLEHIGQAIAIGTYDRVHLASPFANLNKAAVVACGLKLKAPYHLTWSCYMGGIAPCGECATCRDRAAAFAANGVLDPALHHPHQENSHAKDQ